MHVSPGSRLRILFSKLCLAVGWIVLVSQSAAASDPSRESEPGADASCVKTSVEGIQRFYDSVYDLEGRFVQTTESVGFGAALSGESSKSEGRVVLAKPGRMRWEYLSPEPSLVISDGKQLWIYDESAREAQRFAVTEEYLSGAALQFLVGGGILQEAYEIRGGACSGSMVDLLLFPRRAATYERLELRANRETGEILETVLVDLLGNKTRLALHDIRTNRGPAASSFVFVAPPGVRVIDLVPGE